MCRTHLDVLCKLAEDEILSFSEEELTASIEEPEISSDSEHGALPSTIHNLIVPCCVQSKTAKKLLEVPCDTSSTRRRKGKPERSTFKGTQSFFDLMDYLRSNPSSVEQPIAIDVEEQRRKRLNIAKKRKREWMARGNLVKRRSRVSETISKISAKPLQQEK